MNLTGKCSTTALRPKMNFQISSTTPTCATPRWTPAHRDRSQNKMANITVTVYDSTENKRVPVEKLQLPRNGPDGAPLSYKFHHKNSGRQIQDAQTLADAAVKEGDILRLQPEITAGAQ